MMAQVAWANCRTSAIGLSKLALQLRAWDKDNLPSQ
jgi:hypothetical protein